MNYFAATAAFLALLVSPVTLATATTQQHQDQQQQEHPSALRGHSTKHHGSQQEQEHHRALGRRYKFNYIFVTGDWRTGDFNAGTGLDTMAAVDAVCQETAESAGLPGIYYAWFSTSDEDSPDVRFHQSTVPYVRPDGITFANDWTDLIDGEVNVSYFTDEFGLELTDKYTHFDSNCIATNTRSDGSYFGRYGDCNNFSNTSVTEDTENPAGIIGHNSNTDRLGASGLANCDRAIRFLCVQQDAW